MAAFLKKNKGGEGNQGTKKPVSTVKSWYQDRYQMVVMQRNVMFIIMLFSLFVAGLSVYAVATLNESKVFEPYLIQVEDKLGIITQVTDQKIEKYTADEIMVESHIRNYLHTRESYSFTTYQHNYHQKVRLHSTRNVYKSFLSEIDISKSGSPLALQQGAEREVNIKSMQILDAKNPRKWQLRFAVRQYGMPSKGLQKVENYIVILEYEFVKDAMSKKDRYINPLGFRIKAYNKTIEEELK